eukprot:6456899-Amphidinium_carterae.2
MSVQSVYLAHAVEGVDTTPPRCDLSPTVPTGEQQPSCAARGRGQPGQVRHVRKTFHSGCNL